MPTLDQLSQKVQDAIACGRAIPLLLDYRLENLPEYALSVYGLIDGIEFEGTFCKDGENLTDAVAVPLPCEDTPAPKLTLNSGDATAVHKIWSAWHSSARVNFLRFTEVIAQLINQNRLLAALQSAKPVKSARKTSAKRRSAGGTKKSTVRKVKASTARVRKSTAR